MLLLAILFEEVGNSLEKLVRLISEPKVIEISVPWQSADNRWFTCSPYSTNRPLRAKLHARREIFGETRKPAHPYTILHQFFQSITLLFALEVNHCLRLSSTTIVGYRGFVDELNFFLFFIIGTCADQKFALPQWNSTEKLFLRHCLGRICLFKDWRLLIWLFCPLY